MDKSTRLIVFFLCAFKLGVHLLADYHSGFQGDELLHIEAGRHLAWGYMEFPPLIGFLAFVQHLFQSESVFVHHLFPHLAMVLILIYVAKTVVALGGGNRAVFLVLLCLVPVMARSQQLFQPVVFSQLFWVMGFYYLIRFTRSFENRDLWYLTGAVTLAFLTKYDALFFVFGLVPLFFFKSTRMALIRHRFWIHMLLFLIAITPNLLWQYTRGFPVLDMFSRLYETQLDRLSFGDVMGSLVLSLNPLTLLVSVPAIIALFHPLMKAHRVLSCSIVLSFCALLFAGGKAYYFYPIVLTLLPFGGIFWESALLFRRKWLFYPVCVLLFASGLVLLPFSLPITSFDNYLRHEYQYDKNVKEERYSKIKWDQTLAALSGVYDSLPADKQKKCLIWGKHYGQAGALALYGDQYNLPAVFSLHGSFYSWLPSGDMPETIIAFRYSQVDGSDFFEPYFDEVIPVKTLHNPYADEEEQLWQTIFICHRPKQDFATLRQLFARRIFE